MRAFSGRPMVRILPSSARGMDLTPFWGTKDSHALWPKTPKCETEKYCNKLNKEFKNGPYQRKSLKNK